MKWSNVKLVFLRELRDQLRDRRTLFTIAVLPVLLYPLLGMALLQVAQFTQEHKVRVWIVGSQQLPSQSEPGSSSPLLVQGAFSTEYCPETEARLIELVQDPQVTSELQVALDTLSTRDRSDSTDNEAIEEQRRLVQAALKEAECDLLVYFHADFVKQMTEAASRSSETSPPTDRLKTGPPLPIFANLASDKSRIALDRVEIVLDRWREQLVQTNLKQLEVTNAAIHPFQLQTKDIAAEVSRRAAIWARILPFVVLIWALTGAFYPAIDLCAGEKERGTLETLLSSPARRSEIVWGKLLTVMSFSITTSLLNLASMGLTGLFIIRQFSQLGMDNAQVQLGHPPFAAMGWLVLAMIPISALFSALSLAIAAFARSSKEGQYYLMPLLLITLPLMMLPMLPAAELDLGTSFIPVSGMMLLLRSVIEGRYEEAIRYLVPVLTVTALGCLLAIRWAIDQFNNESVLFRESERFGIRLWIRHLVRDRGLTPSFGEAILCGVILLLLRFFAGFVSEMPANWSDFAKSTMVTLIALIATPPLLMAIILTRSPKQTLLLNRPRVLAIPAALLLAVLMHPAVVWFAQTVKWIYPPSPDMMAMETLLGNLLSNAPNLWMILLIIAVTPAICEELAFRGFILSGLRNGAAPWMAILISSVLFGAAHLLLQQSIVACFTGMILGWLAVQTRSLFPCIAYHFANNATAVLVSQVTSETLEQAPWLKLVFQISNESSATPTISVGLIPGIISVLLAVGVFYWFQQSHRESKGGDHPTT